MKRLGWVAAVAGCVLPVYGQAPAPSTPVASVQAQAASNAQAGQIAHMQAQLNDWPGLARYRDDNAKLPPPAAGQNRVVFFGDSITDAWGRLPDTGEFFPGKPYVNRGISGQTTPQMLIRFQQDVVQLKPAVVVILAGTNDIAGNTGPSTPQMIEDNYTSMAEIARASGIRVVFASITPVYVYPWKPSVPHPTETIREVNTWLKSLCDGKGYTCLDYYDAMVDSNGRNVARICKRRSPSDDQGVFGDGAACGEGDCGGDDQAAVAGCGCLGYSPGEDSGSFTSFRMTPLGISEYPSTGLPQVKDLLFLLSLLQLNRLLKGSFFERAPAMMAYSRCASLHPI